MSVSLRKRPSPILETAALIQVMHPYLYQSRMKLLIGNQRGDAGSRQVDPEGAGANGKAVAGKVGRTGSAVTVEACDGNTGNSKRLVSNSGILVHGNEHDL